MHDSVAMKKITSFISSRNQLNANLYLLSDWRWGLPGLEVVLHVWRFYLRLMEDDYGTKEGKKGES